MFLSVTNKDLRRQAYKTSCWITASHFLLEYVGVSVPIDTLHAKYYKPDKSSASVMSGAGQPKTILNEYAIDAGRFVATANVQADDKRAVIDAIAESIRNDMPVIAAIRTRQILGFGHALLITAVDPDTGTIAFKDPGDGTTPRPFGVDVRTVQYDAFHDGFAYKYHRGMQQTVTVYADGLTYLRTLDKMSLFG